MLRKYSQNYVKANLLYKISLPSSQLSLRQVSIDINIITIITV